MDSVETEIKEYKMQIMAYKDLYDNIKKTEKENLSFIHDIKNHLSVLWHICKVGRQSQESDRYFDEIESYIKKICVKLSDNEIYADTGNLSIDAVLNLKLSYAKSHKIDIGANIQIPANMHIDDMDMVTLLGNMLDNAIEACDELKDEKKEILLSIRYDMGNLILSVNNTYNGRYDDIGDEITDINILQTNKSDTHAHGIGMKNIAVVVKKYNGTLNVKVKNRRFSIAIILYAANKSVK